MKAVCIYHTSCNGFLSSLGPEIDAGPHQSKNTVYTLVVVQKRTPSNAVCISETLDCGWKSLSSCESSNGTSLHYFHHSILHFHFCFLTQRHTVLRTFTPSWAFDPNLFPLLSSSGWSRSTQVHAAKSVRSQTYSRI